MWPDDVKFGSALLQVTDGEQYVKNSPEGILKTEGLPSSKIMFLLFTHNMFRPNSHHQVIREEYKNVDRIHIKLQSYYKFENLLGMIWA
jgi:hypothetical protein